MSIKKIKKIKELFKKQWALIWLIAASVALTALITHAEYDEANNKIKRVIAPSASLGGLFTSNYLGLGDNIRSYYTSARDDKTYSFIVDLRNYNSEEIYNGDIEYKITMALAHLDGTLYTTDPDDANYAADAAKLETLKDNTATITVSRGGDSVTLGWDPTAGAFVLSGEFGPGANYTIAGTSGGEKIKNSHEWTVTFRNIKLDTDDYCVKITADPSNTDLENISAAIGIATNPDFRPMGWSGAFSDNTSVSVDRYDAFNYTISGTGEKWLYFCYDPSKIEINDFFAASYTEVTELNNYCGEQSGRSTWRSIRIAADPDVTGNNRYDLQLYKNNSYHPASFAEMTNVSTACIELAQYDEKPSSDTAA